MCGGRSWAGPERGSEILCVLTHGMGSTPPPQGLILDNVQLIAVEKRINIGQSHLIAAETRINIKQCLPDSCRDKDQYWTKSLDSCRDKD